MRNEISFPFWCRDVYQERRTDHNEISTRTECEMMWRPKNIFGRKLNDLGWVCHERWAKSQSQNQSPITLTRYKESRSPKQINATCQQKMIFRSLCECVCVCVVFFFPFSCRLFASFRPRSRFVALHSMWFWFGASKLKNFFRRVHSYFFLFSHTSNCGVVHFSRRHWYFQLSLVFMFVSILAIPLWHSHTAFWVLASWIEVAQQHQWHHHLWLHRSNEFPWQNKKEHEPNCYTHFLLILNVVDSLETMQFTVA